MVKWPGRIPAGVINNKLASTIDFFPTFAEILDVPLPDRKIDGVSILELWENVPNANPRETFNYYYQKNSLEAVRKGNWKLVFPHVHRTYGLSSPGKKGVNGETRQVATAMALYDLRRDPGERYDVQQENPQIVAELSALANEVREDMGDDLMNIAGKNRREPGRIETTKQ
tara:strand:- start:18082 stop:18594 length:513 start_codon:yes stop_codon:yes gene_type:complete